MISDETIEYFATWDIRLAIIDPSNLDGLFNKFTTLFTGFNRLYNEAFSELKAAGKITKSRVADWERATKIPVDFIGADEIIDFMVKSGCDKNITVIADMMNERLFAINLSEGKHMVMEDEQLKADLLSLDAATKAQAILMLIYQVRNNIEHAQKHFQEYQRLLLEPVIDLLENILKLIRRKLKV